MVLIGTQVFEFVGRVVQDLQFHAHIGGVALRRRADAQAVVGAWGELEIEGEVKIRILLGRVEIAAGLAQDLAVFYDVTLGVTYPAGQILAIE